MLKRPVPRRTMLKLGMLSGAALALPLSWPSTASAGQVAARNCGGGAVGSFSPDGNFTGGSAATYLKDIDVTAAPEVPGEVFQSERWGECQYQFGPLPPGMYEVAVYFCEVYFTNAGARKFDVAINGNIVLHEFDIIGTAGVANRALVRKFSTSPDYLGRITIQFIRGSVDFPKVSAIALSAQSCQAAATPSLFAQTSFWNTQLPVNQPIHTNYAAMTNELVTAATAPWINTTQYSTGLYLAYASTPKVPVAIVKNGQALTWTKLYSQCQKGIPIPTGAVPAEGTDGHMTILDVDAGVLYEFWQMQYVNGRWQSSWGGIISNVGSADGIMPVVKNSQGGDEYWGATATSLPVIGGTMLLNELRAGVIPHALAFAIPSPKNTFVWPALRSDGSNPSSNIPEGTRFRFPSSLAINSAWCPMIKMMVTAVRDYGMVLRDKAGAVAFFGEDPTQYGSNPYLSYYGGLQLWDVMRQFPFSQLKALA